MLNPFLVWLDSQNLYFTFHYGGHDSIAITTAASGEEFEYNLSERKNTYTTLHCSQLSASHYVINSDVEGMLPDLQTGSVVYGEKYQALEDTIKQLVNSNKLTITDCHTGDDICEIIVPTFEQSDVIDALETISEMF